jgi:hypothetical protein
VNNPNNLTHIQRDAAGNVVAKFYEGGATRNGVSQIVHAITDSHSKKILGSGTGTVTTAYPKK